MLSAVHRNLRSCLDDWLTDCLDWSIWCCGDGWIRALCSHLMHGRSFLWMAATIRFDKAWFTFAFSERCYPATPRLRLHYKTWRWWLLGGSHNSPEPLSCLFAPLAAHLMDTRMDGYLLPFRDSRRHRVIYYKNSTSPLVCQASRFV